MSKRRFSFGLVLFLLLQFPFLSGCDKVKNASSNTSLTFNGIQVKKGQLQNDTLVSGKIEASQTVNVVSKVSGKVEYVNVDVGSEVKEGQVLLNLEANDLEANIDSTQATADTAKINYDLALKQHQRGQELLSSSAISQADYDNNYQGTYLKAEAGLRSARSNLEKAQIAFQDTFVRAPFNGVVTARNINPGEIALPSVPVISLVNFDQVVIKGGVNENQINQLSSGQVVQVKVAAVAEQPFAGMIAQISPAADPQTKAYTVKIQVDNLKHLLKPGMFAEVKISDQQEQLLIIPRLAIMSDSDKNMVFVVENGAAQKKIIEIGLSDQNNAVVTAGLKEGDTIIVSNLEMLKEGQQVKVQINGSTF